MTKLKDNVSLKEAKQVQTTFRILAAVSVSYVGVGTVAMMYLENFSFIDSLYFSVVSLTTVGYGDYSPETTGGKIFVMVYLLVGIGIIAALASNLVKSVVARRVINDSIDKIVSKKPKI